MYPKYTGSGIRWTILSPQWMSNIINSVRLLIICVITIQFQWEKFCIKTATYKTHFVSQHLWTDSTPTVLFSLENGMRKERQSNLNMQKRRIDMAYNRFISESYFYRPDAVILSCLSLCFNLLPKMGYNLTKVLLPQFRSSCQWVSQVTRNRFNKINYFVRIARLKRYRIDIILRAPLR